MGMLPGAVVTPGSGVGGSKERDRDPAVGGEAGVGRGAAVVGGVAPGARRLPVDVHVPPGDLFAVLVSNCRVSH